MSYKRLLTLGVAFLSSFVSLKAQAAFSCVSHDGGSKLNIYFPGNSRAYEARLTQGEESVLFGAYPSSRTVSPLFSKYEYKLWNGETEAVFTVISRPFFGRSGCGRGGCLKEPVQITRGKLVYEDGAKIDFSCVKTSP